MIDRMTRQQYRQFRHHPAVKLLFDAATQRGRVVHDDEIADLRLPERQERAFREALAIAREAQSARGDAHREIAGRLERGAYALRESLPEDWETVAQQRRRRADLGDPGAIRDLETEGRRLDAIADSIDRDELTGGHAA